MRTVSKGTQAHAQGQGMNLAIFGWAPALQHQKGPVVQGHQGVVPGAFVEREALLTELTQELNALQQSQEQSLHSLQQTAEFQAIAEGLMKEALLRRYQSVLPEDIAEAAYFLSSDLSAKSTGNILNVDAGNVQAFTR